MSKPALELQSLRKQLDGSEIICGVNLRVEAGERVALIGPNGAGKSTLFNLISGRMRPDGGSIYLHGKHIDGLPPQAIQRAGLARSFQISHLFPSLTVRENLRCSVLWSMGYRYNLLRFLSRMRDVNMRVDALLEKLHLGEYQHVPAMHLTYANQRALEMGITVASGAGVILLDEPTAGMSHSETQRCVALIRSLTEGRTLLMVEHDMGVVFDLADKVAVLVDGAVIAFDTPDQVRANPDVQAAYLGQVFAEVGGDALAAPMPGGADAAG